MLTSRGIVLLILLLLFVPAKAQYGFEFEKKNLKKVYVPFELHNNLIVVPVRLNDKLPMKFIVDTGIRTTILTEKIMSDALALTLNRKIILKGPGEQQIIAAHVANNVTIKIPGVVGRGQALLVLEEDFLQLRNYLGVEVHGIIGYELFSRFIVEIDYNNRMLILHQSQFFEPKKSFERFPLTIEDTKPYIVTKIKINGKTTRSKLMIDTGASHALLLEEDEEKNISMPERSIEANIGRGLGGPIKGRLARIDHIKIGEFELKGVISSFPEPGQYLDTVFFNRHGTLGGDLLSRFRVVFDYPSENIYLKKASGFHNKFEHDMSGIELMAEGNNLETFRIMNVREESPAYKAGVRSGDTLLYLNGIRSENLQLNQIYRLFHSKPGRKIRMVISREGVQRKIVYRLKRFI